MPLFVVALQLPQGAVLYWAASSSFALLQVRLGGIMHLNGRASRAYGLNRLLLTSRPLLTDRTRLLLELTVYKLLGATCGSLS